MALHWDLTNIKDHDNLCWIATGKKNDDGTPEQVLNPVTDALIWITMFVDQTLTNMKEAKEFFVRVKMWEKLHGSYLRQREPYWAVTDGKTFDTFDDKDKALDAVTNLGVGAQILEGERSVPRPITFDDVMAHVGLKTNVYSESKAKFKTKLLKSERERLERNFTKSADEYEVTNIDRMKEAIDDHVA